MIKRYAIVIAIFNCSIFKVPAQAILPAQRIDLMMQVAPNDTTNLLNDTHFKSNTQIIVKVIITLNDTIHLSKIHVKLGTANTNYNLLNKFFTFNIKGAFSDGTSYTRDGAIVHLNLGTQTGSLNYYSEIKLEDTFGRFTSPVVVSSN